MATKTSVLASGLNGLIRMPILGAGVASAGLTLEGTYRVLTTAFSAIGVKAETGWVQKLNSHVPHLAVNVLRPFGNLSHKEVAISALVCITVATVGTELANKLCGKASARYNMVAEWVTPFKLDENWRQGGLSLLVNWLNGKGQKGPVSQ